MAIKKGVLAGLLTALFAFEGAALAQDESPVKAGDWLVRTRGIIVSPDESSELNIGGEARVDDAFTPELDFTYFWTDYFATELILATNRHTVGAFGTAVGDVPNATSVSLLPPTLLGQFHIPVNKTFKPYVGAGVNYTFFYNADGGDLPVDSFDDGFGFALQAGVDVFITENVLLNLDVKRLWLSTEASFAGGTVIADVDLDPWIFGAGIGFKF